MKIAQKINKTIEIQYNIKIPNELTGLILMYFCIEIYNNEIENEDGDIFNAVELLSKYVKFKN